MAKLEGFVSKLNTKDGKKQNGAKWTLYSFILELAGGTESPWVSFGFEQPPFKEGDYIAFETDEKDNRHTYKKGSGLASATPPERAKPKTAVSKAVGAPVSEGTKATDGTTRSNAGVAATADRQTSIVMQHSQEMAISAIAVLLEHDALPTSSAATKAGEAKRFSEIMAAIDKLTVKFYNDAATGRLLDTVSDTVIDTTPDAPLPTKKAGAAKTEETDSEDDMAGSSAAPGGF